MHTRLVSILVLTVTVAVGMALAGCRPADSPLGAQSAGKPKYHCPMHPTYVSDRPGDCPICGMRLVLIKQDRPSVQAGHEPRPLNPALSPTSGGEGRDQADKADAIAQVKPGQFYCPMGAEHVQATPGECPKCGMDLVEKKATAAAHEGHRTPGDAVAALPGRVAISVSPEKRQLIGLTLSRVEKRNLTRSVRTAAVVEHDETRYARIAPRFAGWVRTLHVNFTGAPVEKGQPLFTVYSPELFSAQHEYLIAWRGVRSLKDDAPAGARQSAQALLDSARVRLGLFEIGDKEVKELEARGQASAELLFRAPVSGYVAVKKAVEGQAFMAGETLYEIADLSRLWLWAYVFEFDLPWVAVGQSAVVRLPYLTHQSFVAAVTFIHPQIEPQTRRGQVRLEVDNPGRELRPGMWAEVELELKLGEKLVVPASALIDTGQRYVAFVDGPNHLLEPREVRIGAKTDDYYEVLSGLKEGDQVVTRALFLVDSESQLKAAIAGLGAPEEQKR